jgi:hypothetical protein
MLHIYYDKDAMTSISLSINNMTNVVCNYVEHEYNEQGCKQEPHMTPCVILYIVG